MPPRLLSVALLTVAVARAGCGASVGSFNVDRTDPTAVPTSTDSLTPTTTASPIGSSLPPGVTDGGVDDPLALTNAHASILTNTSFRVAVNTTERYENGTIRTRERTAGTFAQDKDQYVVDHVVAGSDSSMMDGSTGKLSAWADGEQLYQRIVMRGSTSYQLLHDANGDRREPSEHILADQIEEDRLYVLLSAFDCSVERVDRDGTPYYQLTSESVSNSAAVAASFDLDEIERASLTAVVDSRGVIHEYRVEYLGSVSDRTVRGIHEAEYDHIGSASVERPSWADEAENATSG